MIIEQIIALIMAAAPSITAIISIIVSVIKMLKKNKVSNDAVISKFEEMRKEVMDTKEFENLKNELEIAHAENRELKKAINELLTKIDRVAREEE